MLTSFMAFVSCTWFVVLSYVAMFILMFFTQCIKDNIDLFCTHWTWLVREVPKMLGISAATSLVLVISCVIVVTIIKAIGGYQGSVFWLGIKIGAWIWWIYYIITRPVVLIGWIKRKRKKE